MIWQRGGLTRKPDGDRAAALARTGVEIIKGDLDDEATLRSALAGAWGVFAVQNTAEAGVTTKSGLGPTNFILPAGHNLAVNWKTGFRPNAS